MRPAEVFRTATFRTAVLAACAFGASILMLFAFIYGQSAGLEAARIDEFLVHESLAISRERAGAVAADVETRYAWDLHRLSFAALFDAAHRKLTGDLATFPAGLAADGAPVATRVLRRQPDGTSLEEARAIARRLADGRILVLCRSDPELANIQRLLLRALLLGLVPSLLSAICIGAFASRRSISRVQAINDTLGRIMQGHLDQRLPPGGGQDALSQLSASVNRMLDEIERLMEEVRGVGDDIAHDLRTPLSRVHARLENGRAHATSLPELARIIDGAIADLDQAFVMMTAILRIGQIEGSARRSHFVAMNLSELAAEAIDLYQPLAELRGISLVGMLTPGLAVLGDRDLLFEAVANLLDNAVKFTPEGGQVQVQTQAGKLGAVLTVQDSGPGIAESERAAVLKRFHRADRTRSIPGHGLGLSLVAAIVRLHMYHLRLGDAGPGLVVEMRCWA